MTDSFDPYRQWLGIDSPAGETTSAAATALAPPPLNHYELLGLPLFESDPETLSQAAARSMNRVRSIRPGPHVAEWQRVLGELAEAKRCLTTPGLKDEYDARLRNPPPILPPTTDHGSTELAEVRPLTTDHSPPVPMAIPVASCAVFTPHSALPTPHSPKRSFSQPAAPLARRRSPARLATAVIAVGVTAAAVFLAIQMSREEAARRGKKGSDGDEKPVARIERELDPRPTPEQRTIQPKKLKPRRKTEPTRNSKPETIRGPDQGANAPRSPITKPEIRDTKPEIQLPPPMLTKDEAEKLSAALTAARKALADRRLQTAADQLAIAEPLAKTDAAAEMVERLDLVRQYHVEFWKAVERGMESLRLGDELAFGDIKAFVVSSSADEITIKAGKNFDYRRSELPRGLALAIAETALDPKAAATQMIIGAFVALEPPADREKARKLWQEAARLGGEAEPLLKWLDDRYDVESLLNGSK